MLAPEVGRVDRCRVLEFRILPGEFIHDELSQSDVGPAHLLGLGYKRTAARTQLANSFADDVDQGVRVAYFFQCLVTNIRVQGILSKKVDSLLSFGHGATRGQISGVL